MEIVWDERKRQANLAKHGLDFAALTPAFFLAATVYPGAAGRFVAIAPLAGRPAAAVFQPLGQQGVAIVSLRPASRKERDAWSKTP